MHASSPIRMLILSDGRAGHFRRSEAIAAAIARRRSVEVTKVATTLPRWLPRSIESFLRTRISPKSYMRLVYGGRWREFPPADIVVSAGGQTLGTNIALARLRGIPNIFSGNYCKTPHLVSLTLTTFPGARSLPRHEFVLTPSQIDADSLGLPGPGLHQLGVLIGGPTKSITYGPDDWASLARMLLDLVNSGLEITAVTSPRTPPGAYEALEPLAHRVNLIDFRKAGVGSINRVYALDALLVTIDSMSMISEGVSARRPVIALEPAHVRPFRDAEIIDLLQEQQRLARLKMSEASAARVKDVLSRLTPTADNQMDLLAETILRNIRI